jgi:uncharacterized UPF0160 family protein
MNLSSLVQKLRHEIIYHLDKTDNFYISFINHRFNDQSISVLISTPINMLMSHSQTRTTHREVCLSELVSLVKNARTKETRWTDI